MRVGNASSMNIELAAIGQQIVVLGNCTMENFGKIAKMSVYICPYVAQYLLKVDLKKESLLCIFYRLSTTDGLLFHHTHTKNQFPKKKQKGYNNYETTIVGKLSTRRIQIFWVHFCVINFDLIFKMTF